MNLPQYQPERIDITRFREIAEKYGVYYTIHLDENLNIADFNSCVAKAYLDTVLETTEIATRLHAPVLNMHLSRGVYFTLPERKIFFSPKMKNGISLQCVNSAMLQKTR